MKWRHLVAKFQTFPEAQRTQAIDSISLVISIVEIETSCKDNFRYRVNTLAPRAIRENNNYPFHDTAVDDVIQITFETSRKHIGYKIMFETSRKYDEGNRAEEGNPSHEPAPSLISPKPA